MNRIVTKPTVAKFAVLALVIASAQLGCKATYQERDIAPSGFLKDYAELKPGTGDQALYRYVKPGVDWKKYTESILDPLSIYKTPESDLNGIPEEELKSLADYLDATLREHLKNDYTFVTTPGPDVMRIRCAITGASGGSVGINIVSSILPIGIALANVGKLVSGKYAFVGQAGIEAEFLDSMKGTRLAGAMDARAGSKTWTSGNKFATWSDVKSAFDFWAERCAKVLTELRTTGNAN